MNRVRVILILLTAALALCPASKATLGIQDDDSPCDAKVLDYARADNTGYKSQGDRRCEGFYDKQVSTSTPLVLRSFLSSPSLGGALPSPIKVSWRLSTDRQVELRASPLKNRVYFQMDAKARGSDRTYEWPTSALQGASLAADQMGLTASYVDNGQRIYLPAHIDNAGSGGAGNYRLALWPELGFKQVYISVTNQNGGEVLKSMELGRAPYPATRPIQFQIPIPSAPGLYVLAVSATFEARPGAYSLRIPFEVVGR